MVTGLKKEGLVSELTAREHKIISGLPERLGGHDEGADPHELLEASLAACTILTAQLYANRKGIALTSTDVTVMIVREGEETEISRQVTFRGELTPEQKQRLTEIVDKCPIHRLLQGQVKITTEVK